MPKKLSSAQDAIKQAHEEGHWLCPKELDGKSYSQATDIVFLDPLFWQALGKARGWKDRMHVCNGCGLNLDIKEITTWNKCRKCDSDVEHQYGYKLWAHQWFENSLSNGDEQKFWESLP
jgi:hypothetical protein